jgi:hypothetical protein
MTLDRDLYAEDALRMNEHQRRRAPAVVDRDIFADDVRRMNEHQRRRRERRVRNGLSPWIAFAIAGGAVVISALMVRLARSRA